MNANWGSTRFRHIHVWMIVTHLDKEASKVSLVNNFDKIDNKINTNSVITIVSSEIKAITYFN